ncbi:SatD family protein [uncultured Croceitalea sp.]|uniref:SatD family protein n=1 Tax=uncultured Croceitalea sp. TaxID=1798908 RepID=UPI0033060E3B
MNAVITGDIINSRKLSAKEWMPKLKHALNKYGKEPKDWEIYRGDSFQLKTTPETALQATILIKSTIKQFKKIDVRTAIGIGETTYQSDNITESSGSAYINSGTTFENLKKQTLAIKTPWEEFNESLNLMFELASLTMDNWTPTSSLIIKTAIDADQNVNQKELAILLDKKQSNISAGLKRGGYYEIQKLLNYYKKEIQKRC